MTDHFVRALTGDGEQQTVTLRRRYRATPAEVWHALTTPERIARWFGTVTGPVPTRPGDEFRVDIGGGMIRRAVIEHCDAPRSLGYTWWSGDDDPGAVRIRLARDRDETVLTVTHDRLRPHRTVGYGAGWELSLSALATTLGGSVESEDPTPRWELLRERPLELTMHLDAPRERVWDAWTTESGLSSWWWSHWFDVEVEADVRVGGVYRLAAPAHGMSVTGEYVVVERGERLAFTWIWIDVDGASVDEAVEVSFADDGGGTSILVRHTGPWATDEPVGAYRQGWEFVLAALARATAPS